MKGKDKYFEKLNFLASQFPSTFDPLTDIGEFDRESMTFKEDVTDLKNPFGFPYPVIYHELIYEMRNTYIEWQKDIIKYNNENISFKDNTELRDQFIISGMKLGFSSSEIAEWIGYTPKQIRRLWNGKHDYLEKSNKKVYALNDLRKGIVKNKEKLPKEISKYNLK